MPRITKKQQRALRAVEVLKLLYPDATCTLKASDAFQVLVAVRLSAQCTDARVDTITPGLFNRFPDAPAMASPEITEVEELIHSCGLYKTKARDLVAMANMLIDKYNGEIPSTIEELTLLPGVGRKTANLVGGDIFGVPGVVVADTHCIRIAGRLKLTDSTDPKKVEFQLRALLPADESGAFCHRLVRFGRDICSARSPKCNECPLRNDCPSKTT